MNPNRAAEALASRERGTTETADWAGCTYSLELHIMTVWSTSFSKKVGFFGVDKVPVC